MLIRKSLILLVISLIFSPLAQAIEERDFNRLGVVVDSMSSAEFDGKLQDFFTQATHSEVEVVSEAAQKALQSAATIEDKLLFFNMYANATKFQEVTMAVAPLTQVLSKMQLGNAVSREFKIHFLYLLEVENKAQADAAEKLRHKAEQAAKLH
jgi:hypothetical protein